jgi:hypothetical protein
MRPACTGAAFQDTFVFSTPEKKNPHRRPVRVFLKERKYI